MKDNSNFPFLANQTGEMQQLGISTKKDMVKLRSECANYGIRKPQRSQSECGPPKFTL
jgi:hypothetical protein